MPTPADLLVAASFLSTGTPAELLSNISVTAVTRGELQVSKTTPAHTLTVGASVLQVTVPSPSYVINIVPSDHTLSTSSKTIALD